MNRIMERLTYANVMVTVLAVLVVGGGGAYAAGVKLKNNSVTTSKIKDGAVTTPKLADGAATNAKIAGNAVTGGQVQDGTITGADVNENSLDGVRRFGDAIPSGTTVIGVWGGSGVVDTDTPDEFDFLVSLPAAAPTALTDANVNFTPGTSGADDDATCDGTVDAPTGPPGKVCLYTNSNVGGSPALSGASIGSQVGPNRLGFLVTGTAAAGTVYAHGTWTYTAP